MADIEQKLCRNGDIIMSTCEDDRDDVFFLAPPLISKKGYGFSVIQIGESFSETILLRMEDWTGTDFIRFWLCEFAALLEGTRTKGLLPTGLHRPSSGCIHPEERWEIFRIGDAIVFHDRTTFAVTSFIPQAEAAAEKWWTYVEDYSRGKSVDADGTVNCESEWRVSISSVADWCHKYNCVLGQMENIDDDGDYAW